MRRIFLCLPVWVVATLFAACDTPQPAPPRTNVAMAPVSRPPTPSDSLCPRDGRWRDCHLADRINKAGMGISVMDTITVPYFTAPGTRYRLGKTAKLVAFYFADSAAAVTATAGLHAQRLTPGGGA